jgi:hypothetical protein
VSRTRVELTDWGVRIHHQGEVTRYRCGYCHRYVTVTRDEDNGTAALLHEPGALCIGWSDTLDALAEMFAAGRPR